MDRFKAFIEQHPYIAGGAVLALLLLFIAMRNRGSGSASSAAPTVVQTGPSDAIQAAELQAGYQAQMAQLSAQTKVAGYNAAVNAAQLQQAAAANTTGARLTLGLAQLGYQQNADGSISKIGGAAQPAQPAQQPAAVVVSQSTVAQNQAAQATAQNTAIAAATSSPASNPASATVPVSYNGVSLNIPSAAGLTYDQYMTELVSQGLVSNNVSPFDAAGIARNQAVTQAALNEYDTDPLSGHNKVLS